MSDINEKLLKPYDSQETEGRIYKLWEESGFFNPDVCVEKGVTKADAKAFTIMMPPPNVTGVLHMGHALGLTIQDVFVRYKRMNGFKTLWLPGTDHAAIATQSKVEKDIQKKEGKNRHDLGREELLKRVEQFATESHDTIVSQIRVMGASCDWSREAFTLDEKRNKAVRTIFKMMYDDGLIYRGHRIVNWDPKGQTTISDDEIVYEDQTTKFYYLKYGPFVIGTSRPETKFGDKYVVMHPDDKRYSQYKDGQKIEVEWINGPITTTVIKDTAIDMEFGTGVMTITPWHDRTDFEIAERHGLEKEQIIDLFGKLLPIAGEFAGMKIKDAREKIIEKLNEKGLVEKIEDAYAHRIATAERTGGIIEPQILLQWFVAVNKEFTKNGRTTTLKELMKKALESGEVSILPEHFSKTYFHWINNLQDWCISRQIWYGHQVPVWYKGEEIYVGLEAPDGEGWKQEEDTLDTWFSSGLWSFSTLGWPEKTKDLETFHPTSLIVPAYEILFFWIARMILMTGYALDAIPFEKVYLTGIVRDAQGKKFSKSLGNGIDPIDIANKYGADAGRMAVVYGTAPGTDSKMSEDKIKGYKHFSNKVWNITRFILESTKENHYNPEFSDWTEIDKNLLGAFKEMLMEYTKEIESYRIHIAAERIYQYAWYELADKIIEESKPMLKDNDQVVRHSREQLLLHILIPLLKGLHPFMPFITEEIWSLLPHKENKLLMIETWPS